jgi:GDP-L-fucose synthase
MQLMGTRVIVTGGGGFLGSHVVDLLQREGAECIVPRSRDCDLTRDADVRQLFADFPADAVVHLAAEVGGIGANMDAPGRFIHANLLMGTLVMEQARLAGVSKYLQAGTVCAYPKFTPVPFREDALWDGYPEETNAAYGIAKRAMLEQARAYRAQYRMNVVTLLPVNLYGPRDDFDPRTSHVIPALIRRMTDAADAGLNSITLWGDGSASREFLFVEDAARAFVLALARYDRPDPVNIGCGSEISIRELAALIAEVTGYDGAIEWDPSMPNGQPRRCLDVSRAREMLGFTAAVPLPEGIRATAEWYRAMGPGAST